MEFVLGKITEGKGSHRLTIPARWVKDLGWKKGDYVVIGKPNDKTIMIQLLGGLDSGLEVPE